MTWTLLPDIVVQCSTPASVRKVLVSNLSLELDCVEFLVSFKPPPPHLYFWMAPHVGQQAFSYTRFNSSLPNDSIFPCHIVWLRRSVNRKYMITVNKHSDKLIWRERFREPRVETVAYRGGWGVHPPPPEIPKALENRAKLKPIVKNVKNCWI